jgi:hypothetical protein
MKYRNNYAKHFTVNDNYDHELLVFNHACFDNVWYLTIENKLTGYRETREYKTQSAVFGTITKTVNRFFRANTK